MNYKFIKLKLGNSLGDNFKNTKVIYKPYQVLALKFVEI